ncbi:unnamed protein product [Notodromas monacha]|uniref:Protein kinase C and casein kinase substrate in neurons protein 1 n=1 Tax=Notodromas monacha TaxID=399045 RepID=A0A7R9BJ54_9CRUS|nr:unnamed protein product [Notodromas monacha]CAG0916462.1 unnamed protein product [Notodromas monacha]
MSQHSDDALLTPTTESFWEPGNYKRTTKRIEDGNKLCNELVTLLQERAEIEKSYAKSLKGWSKKWNEIIEKGPEYGTMEAAWKGTLMEAERLSEVHVAVRDKLVNEVSPKIRDWQKENYHKSMMQIKEKKDMDDKFKKEQKPWAKLLDKVNKARADYHTACKNEKTAINQDRNSGADTSLSPDALRKLKDRVDKAKEEVQKTKERYEFALKEINDYNPIYVENMTKVFEKCQESEADRLMFIKDILFLAHESLNISTNPQLPQIYEELHHTINNADNVKDLRWWSNNHGVNMAMNWPQFEEYSEEFREIAKKNPKTGGHIPDANITLLHQRSVGEDLPEYTADGQRPSYKFKKPGKGSGKEISSKQETQHPSSSNPSPSSSDKGNNVQSMTKSHAQPSTNGTTANNKDANPFEEEEWEDYSNDALVDNGEVGVPVRALYDYDGVEADELSFKTGDVFEKLEDEDEQGWCKGRKDGRVGLYPANYVEAVSS